MIKAFGGAYIDICLQRNYIWACPSIHYTAQDLTS
jgi:hypothetical protein